MRHVNSERCVKVLWILRKSGIALMASAVAAVSNAVIVAPPGSLSDGVRLADVVVHGRVSAIVPKYFENGLDRELCGTNFAIEVIEIFKGNVSGQFDFATFSIRPVRLQGELKIGDELLVLAVHDDAPVDPLAIEVSDVIYTEPSNAKRACLRLLSKNRPLATQPGIYLISMERWPMGGSQRSLHYVPTDTSLDGQPLLSEMSYAEMFGKHETHPGRVVRWKEVREQIPRWLRAN